MNFMSYKSMRRAVGCLAAGLTLIGLSAIAEAAQPVAIVPFDNPAFSTAEAQAAWIPEDRFTTAISADTWANERVMVVSCNMDGSPDRCNSDHAYASPTDLSIFREFSLEIFVPNPEVVRTVSVYLESAPQWQKHFSKSMPTKRGWQTLTFRAQDFAPGGPGAQAPNWKQISKIRLTLWEGVSTAAGRSDIAIRSFQAVPRNAVALVKDFPSGTFFHSTTSTLLAGAYIAHDIISVADIEKGYLNGAKMVILPYNSGLSNAALTAIENFVAAGGRIMANHNIDARVQALLGVNVVAYTTGATGQFASFQFSDSVIPNLPPVVLHKSGGVIQCAVGDPTRSPHPRVIANWNDYNGTAGLPAWIASDTGLYMSNVLLGNNEDTTTKSKMLLSLLSYYPPEIIGRESADAAIADIARVGKYTDFEQSVYGIRSNELRLLASAVSQIETAIANTESLRNTALQAQSEGRYFDAVVFAKQARPYLRDAYNLSQAAGPSNEFRAIWSHAGSGPYPGDWARSIDLLSSNGFNTVVANVAGAGFADYASDYLPRSSDFSVRGDQLAALVTAGHSAGIKTHAWILTWGMHGAPVAWISDMQDQDQDRLMQKVVTSGAGVLELKPVTGPNVTDPYWLSPCDQRNRDLIKASILEMASNYEIDGIHLDYIRTNGTDSAFEFSCKARFEKDTGRNEPENQIKDWPAAVFSGSLRAEYAAWKPSVITSFVKEVHDALIPVNEAKLRRGQPHVVLSAAVNSDPIAGRNTNAQDWPTWISEGAIDVLHPLNYMTNLADFNYALADQASVIANRVPFYPGIGISGALNTDEMIARSISTRGDNPGGVVTGGFIHFQFNTDLISKYLPAYASGMTSNKTAQAADLNLTASSTTGFMQPGIPFTYMLTVSNHGPDTATGVVVNDWLPTGVTLNAVTTSQGSCTAGEIIQCQIGAVSANAFATITFTVTATDVGDYTNEASVISDGTDPYTLDNAAMTKVTVAACVSDLVARAKASKVQLTWTNDPNAASYNVYRSTMPGGPYIKIANTISRYSTYLDETVLNGINYFYVVSEVALNANELCLSNETSALPNVR